MYYGEQSAGVKNLNKNEGKGDNYEKINKDRTTKRKSWLGMCIMGSNLLGLRASIKTKERRITMKKLTKTEQQSVKAGWVCVLWGAICWG
ncbi:hypothetical protein IW492_01150 [Enterococcus sp. BWB1-3]|uniref:hypothetical protein n=1 Tax=unclassified Enterococcus TaxID=2608891 RepID=UPI00192317BB|nr:MULTISPECIES: hypothetical protein [unclassified Enterococcus]MBL1227836.1 hypothetical protein [Enterococcus sp. BWB1-3]MCB5953373.1 hypothetical protein [Enterococcus sp. BWT-B8]